MLLVAFPVAQESPHGRYFGSIEYSEHHRALGFFLIKANGLTDVDHDRRKIKVLVVGYSCGEPPKDVRRAYYGGGGDLIMSV